MTSKPESRLRTRIAKALRARGWLVVVQHGGLYSQVGVADLLGCARGRFFALEVKMPGGSPAPAQYLFIDTVAKAGGISAIVRSPEAAIAVIEEGLTMADDWDDLFDDGPAQVVEVANVHHEIIGDPPQEVAPLPVALTNSDTEATAAGTVRFETINGPLDRPSRLALVPDPEPVIVGPTSYEAWRASNNLEPLAEGEATLDSIAYDVQGLYRMLEAVVEQLTRVVELINPEPVAPATPPVDKPKRSRKRAEPVSVLEQQTLDQILE